MKLEVENFGFFLKTTTGDGCIFNHVFKNIQEVQSTVGSISDFNVL